MMPRETGQRGRLVGTHRPAASAAAPLAYNSLEVVTVMKASAAVIAKTLEDFLEGRSGTWDWDDFISTPLDDPALERIRRESARLPDTFPPVTAGEYCSPEGMARLRELLDAIAR